MLRAELKIVGGKHHGKLIPLSRSKFLIGRGDDCQLRPASDLVSRHHCVFKVDDYTARLRDLGSTNGTFVNGERIRGEVLLKTGDRVTIGKLELEMVIHEEARVAQPSGAGGGSPAPVEAETPAAAPPLVAPETEVLSTAETSLEIPAVSSGDGYDETSVLSSDVDDATKEVHSQTTQIVSPAADPQQLGGATPPPGAPLRPPGQYPQFPPGYFGQPGMGQPGMPYPYPQGQYPGYPQMPGGYPQYPGYPAYYPPPGYPDQYGQYPGYYPPQGAPVPDETTDHGGSDESSEASEIAELPVRLPDPETTGAKPPEPPAEKPQAEEGAKPPVKPSNLAADIIKNFRQRRPGS